MNEEIGRLLQEEEQRIEVEERAHEFRGYVTGPSGMWKIHQDTLRRRPLGELTNLARESGYKDLSILKVLYDGYTSIAQQYLERQREEVP